MIRNLKSNVPLISLRREIFIRGNLNPALNADHHMLCLQILHNRKRFFVRAVRVHDTHKLLIVDRLTLQ